VYQTATGGGAMIFDTFNTKIPRAEELGQRHSAGE